MKAMRRNRALLLLLCLAPLAGCQTVKSWWPWGGDAMTAPEPVRELEVTVPADMAVPVVLQYWERNTLVVDLQGASTAGQIRLSPVEGKSWPARVGFRMSPTRFEALEVRGEQRIVLPLSQTGGEPVTVELPAGVYRAGTQALTVSWGMRSAF